MKLYISFLSVMVLVLLYLPLAIWVIRRIVRGSGYRGMRAVALFVACLIAAAAIPLGDVVVHSWNMAKACQRAGLHIYKKVQVEGYYDPTYNQYLLQKHPYRFFEYGPRYAEVFRVERQADGSTVESRIKEPTAEYEIAYESHVPDPAMGVNRLRWWAKNRLTGEAIGEYLGFTPFYGWVDRYIVQRWFGTIGGNVCWETDKMTTDWRVKLLPPKR